jgi:carbamate kinase
MMRERWIDPVGGSGGGAEVAPPQPNIQTAMIAIGGNSLILDGQRGTIAEQFENARATARRIGGLVDAGWRIVVTHGNGPQVGFILLRSELASDDKHAPRLSLDMCVADSQGGLGYIIGNSLLGELGRRGHANRVSCLLTQTVVDPDDPAFRNPRKPIGPFFTAEEATLHQARDRWVMVEDAGRGHRRVVPSPRPRRIVEGEAIRTLLDAGFVVIACGGGGIPVVETEPGVYQGVEAVVDKDHASALLAAQLGVPVLVLATGVEKVAIRYKQPGQTFLDRLTTAEARRYMEAGEFPPGSMGPKMQAAIEFLERGGQEVIVTSPEHLEAAVAGKTGTHVVP